MKNYKGSVNSIETFGLVDGPGIRTVVFLNGCRLRCKYCHNPEMWNLLDYNYSPEDLANLIIRNKPYFKNGGGVTFSGGEPLLQSDFIIEVCKILKKENIHTALDTAGVGNGNYEEILKYIDLIILDIKHTDNEVYMNITGKNIDESLKFIDAANKLNKDFWIRQVVIPNITNTDEYMKSLKNFLKNINNIKKIEFLPYHKLGKEKYDALNLPYPYDEVPEMDIDKCKKLYEEFKKTMD